MFKKNKMKSFLIKKFDGSYQEKRSYKFFTNNEFSVLFKLFLDKKEYEEEYDKFSSLYADKQTLKEFNALFGINSLAYIMYKKDDLNITNKDLIEFLKKENNRKINREIANSTNEDIKKYKKIAQKIGV